MKEKRILSVGQCGADHVALRWSIRQHFQAEVIPAETAQIALDLLRQSDFDLVLVNRVLDRDGSPGQELIDRIKSDDALRHTPVMLISDIAAAQQAAQASGSVPGFGKSALGQQEMIEALTPFAQ